ncbi:helix-turn-helix domain-containing protein [Phreatobacter sp. HK31-P]
MTKTFGERVREERDRINMKAPELARLLGVDVSSVYSLEKGKSKLPNSPEMIARYAEILKCSPSYLMGYTEEKFPGLRASATFIRGVPVVGVVEAGAFRSSKAVELADPLIPASPDPRFANAEQFALRVDGNSVNRKVGDGGYVIVTPFADARHQPANHDLLVISRWLGTLCERTVRELIYTAGGYELKPVSTDPQHQESILIDPKLKVVGSDDQRVTLDYLVLGFYTPAHLA